MRIVALEEHFALPDITARIDKAALKQRGWPPPGLLPPSLSPGAVLADLGDVRLAAMDEAGVALQVLSVAGPGADLMEPAAGIDLARDYNDRLAGVVRGRPDRFSGFAHLPMTAPEAGADELERAVRELGLCGALINGMTQGRFLDDPAFEPILARAEALDVPLYLHPGVPTPEIRKVYYEGLPGPTGYILGMAAWGWHSETAIHVLRLVLSGTLDRHPGLKLIVGHMGEGLPAMLDRFDHTLGETVSAYLSRPVSRTILDQVWVTTSGMYSLAPFMALLMTFGADRIMFSIDYPFSPSVPQTEFLRGLPVSPADKVKIAHGNADALLKLKG